jgi:hypothetical protein
MSYPTSLVFVNSISYDGSQDINDQNWQPTSVWGPLRVINTTKEQPIVSWTFDDAGDIWNKWGTTIYDSASYLDSSVYALGNGSNKLSLSGSRHIYSENAWGVISAPGYYVWSIHTYLPESYDVNETQLHGEIVSEDGSTALGYVYIKRGQ